MSWIAQDRSLPEPPRLGEALTQDRPWDESPREGRLTLRQILSATWETSERFELVQVIPHPHQDTADEPSLDEVNWPAAIEMIRDAGARMRQMRRTAQDQAQQAQVLMEGSLQRLAEMERRLRHTEAALKEARQRAEQAELAARMADARARRAEEETQIARSGQAEAQMWLRRLYANMRMEFAEIG